MPPPAAAASPGNAAAAAAPAVTAVTATAIATRRICPNMPHLPFLGGLALVGLRSPTALEASYGRNMLALLLFDGPWSGMLSAWPAVSVLSAESPFASASLYQSELSPHRFAAMPR